MTINSHAQPRPTWQRGHRVHGYWLDGQRVGHVGLSPRGFPRVYSWAIDACLTICGEERDLQTAKRRVEAAFQTRLFTRILIAQSSDNRAEPRTEIYNKPS